MIARGLRFLITSLPLSKESLPQTVCVRFGETQSIWQGDASGFLSKLWIANAG